MLSPRIDIICGPMYSGKSAELVKRLNDYAGMGLKCLLIRPNLDVRDFLTRHKYIKPVGYDIIHVDDISEAEEYVDKNNVTVIGIDESFMIKGLSKIPDLWLVNGKSIIASGLTISSEFELFKEFTDLFRFASSVTWLTAVCHDCGQSANYTYYVGNKSDKGQLLVGDSCYIPLCFKCLQNRGGYEST